MKTRVSDPKVAALAAGGCTFEPEIGWWTYTTDPALAEVLGKPFEGCRDAIYIPTIQKSGDPVDADVVEVIKRRARQLGLHHLACAQGMWILSETGEAQVEVVWIAWASSCERRNQLSALAQFIKTATNQDCVAWEVAGELNFTGTNPVEVAA